MKLLKLKFDHVIMFEDGVLELDFYAQDKVPAQDESVTLWERPVYTNNVVAIAGINASGKSVALGLVDLALNITEGNPVGEADFRKELSGVFEPSFTMNALVWLDGSMYLLESHMTSLSPLFDVDVRSDALSFVDESVYRIDWKGAGKGLMARDFADLASAGELVMRRSELGAGDRRFLRDDTSVFSALVEGRVRHLHCAATDLPLTLAQGLGGLDEALRTFDPSIEHLAVEDDGRAFELKLSTLPRPLVLSRSGLEGTLSSGTLKGLAVVQRAVLALRAGTYLLLDEVEMHLNRQLVNVVIDLFTMAETNPKGATLVFSTHYPEVLDHLHRKDNVYFLSRGQGGKSRAVKYSSKVKRIENRKSEVYASNYLGGTAPRYADVAALRDYVASAVGGEDDR